MTTPPLIRLGLPKFPPISVRLEPASRRFSVPAKANCAEIAARSCIFIVPVTFTSDPLIIVGMLVKKGNVPGTDPSRFATFAMRQFSPEGRFISIDPPSTPITPLLLIFNVPSKILFVALSSIPSTLRVNGLLSVHVVDSAVPSMSRCAMSVVLFTVVVSETVALPR